MTIRLIQILTLFLFSIQVHAQVPEATGTGTLDNTMNWIISRKFNALGTVSDETKLFYDNKGNLLQSQSKVFNARADADPAKKVHVLASQPIYDNLGRSVITTMLAPINSKGFSYQASFANYTHQNFDDVKTYNPDPVPVGGAGTLGWYYSDNNTWEKYTPKTSYPYSRVNYYKDGTNTIKRIAAEGDYHKMGMNHEEASYSVAVINELDHYLQVRNKYFASAGELPVSLKFKAIQNIFKDPNGVVSVNMVDKDGNILMSGKPGSLHTVNNSVALTSYVYGHTFTNAQPQHNVSRLQLNGTGNGKIYVNGSLVYTGTFNNYTYPGLVPANATVNLVSDKPFYSSYCLQIPFLFFYIDWPISTNFPSGEVADANAIHYFYLFAASQVSVSGGNFSLINMDPDENTIASQAGPYSATLPTGYYKFVATSGDVTLNYANSYDDLVYDFNNQIGQTIASITAEGVKKIITQGLAAFATLNDVPFAYKYEYDMKGQVVTENDPDRGVFKSVYKKNGYLKFTQNNDQFANGGKYSYINYDKKNRVTEIGEFNPNAGGPAFNSAAMLAIVENTASSDGLTGGVKTGVMKTTYDYADNTHIFYTLGYFQQDYGYLRSQISTTENDNMKTWFGYNEHGMVSFTIRWIKELGNDGFKSIEYKYDKAGNLVKVTYQALNSAESFVHQYVYDEDQRVKEVYTTTNAALGFDPNNPSWKLQARYQYYLHGPLKREELAGNLQGIDYTYTIQGWLKAINHPNQANDPGGDGQNGSTAFVKDAFGMSLEYFSGDYQKANTNIASLNIPLGNINTYYEGTVKGASFFSKKTGSMPPGSDAPVSFAYQYDNDYQFSESFYGTPDFNTNNYVQPGGALANKWKERATGYDQNGNIQGLIRHDASGNLSENFASYSYQTNTNKLSSVTNYASFAYNTIGQVTSIASVTGVTKYVAYDSYGGVLSVANNSPTAPPFVSFLYDEGGERIAKKTSSVSYYYVYDNSGEVLAVYSKAGAASPVLQEQMVYGAHRVGTYYRQAGSYQYELQDNTGNVRAVIGQTPITGNLPDITQFNDFYPYGSITQAGGTGYRFDYQGLYSEKDPETGWNSFDLRQLDAKIGRWLSPDPAGQYASPYISMGNNPIMRVDPSGGEDTIPRAVWEDWWVWSGTNIIRDDGINKMATVSNHKPHWTDFASSLVHTVLDFAADYVPIPAIRIAASLLNAGLYAIEGNTSEAVSSLAGIIPGGKKLLNGVQVAQQFYHKAQKLGNGLHKVYQGYDKAGNVKYVGRTIMPMRIRAMAHRAFDKNKKDLVFSTRISGLDKAKARKWEQTLINVNGGSIKTNPATKLLNKINSIKKDDWGSSGVVQQVIHNNKRL